MITPVYTTEFQRKITPERDKIHKLSQILGNHGSIVINLDYKEHYISRWVVSSVDDDTIMVTVDLEEV